MSIIHLPGRDGQEPTAAELEWPLIAAGLDLLDAEISYITAGPAASVLDRRRIRRAERRLLAVSRELAADEIATDGAA